MKITMKALPSLLERTIKAGITSFIHGQPGVGKSDAVRQLAEKFKLKLIDVRLSQIDPLDMSGLPSVNSEKTKASYLPMDMFPLDTDAIPDGFNGFLLFLDEANAAPRSVQAAAFQLTLDKAIGRYALHPKTAIIMAGNNETDGGITTKISTPMMSRLAHFEVELDHKSWIEWGHGHGIDYRITSFIELRPDLLNKFNPKTQDKTFSCPRTWEFASKLIKGRDTLNHEDTVLLSSVVSEGIAREFVAYTNIFGKLSTIEQILDNPELINIPNEPSVKYAYTGLLSNTVNPNNILKAMKFIARLPVEMQIITMIPLLKKFPEINNHLVVSEWKANELHSLL